MVWVAASAFLVDPQTRATGGDGDIHVQTMTDCPAAGVTTENTPPLRGYVDHPPVPGLSSSNDMSDDAVNHLADAPPVGVPVMILGATRYDYGFGWWELHPIRAWRLLTPAETAQLAADCAADPLPHLDGTAPTPVPFGVPPCTDGSEFGNPGGLFNLCRPQCYVAHTAIAQPETLAGLCAGIEPQVTPSQAGLSEAGVGAARSSPPAPRGNGRARGSTPSARRRQIAALRRAYGDVCAALRVRRGYARAFDHCLLAMARIAGGETRVPDVACRLRSNRQAARRVPSSFSLCVVAARSLLAHLAPARVAEAD
jgi:hypothetical protein